MRRNRTFAYDYVTMFFTLPRVPRSILVLPSFRVAAPPELNRS